MGRQLAVARELVGSQAGLPALVYQLVCWWNCAPRLEGAVSSQQKVQDNANSPHVCLEAIIGTGAQRSDDLRGCSAHTTAAVRGRSAAAGRDISQGMLRVKPSAEEGQLIAALSMTGQL